MQLRTSSEIGALVRERRVGLGWSQQELARRVGVSRIWVVQLEKGKPTAQIGLALRTLKELGVTLNSSPVVAADSGQRADSAIDLNSIIQGTLPGKL